ncbi:hypothetical protein ATY27_13915 [Rheinheimera sp. F8]|nr:hypothetical protein ATY27_13915 [Rheinheimera sp. F8]
MEIKKKQGLAFQKKPNKFKSFIILQPILSNYFRKNNADQAFTEKSEYFLCSKNKLIALGSALC